MYRIAGLKVKDRVCFTCLADANLIDEETTLYLTTLHLSIEELIGELEEEGEAVAGEVLRRIAEELGEMVDLLTQTYHPREAPSFASSQVQEAQPSTPYIA